jgi:hypothetical protein
MAPFGKGGGPQDRGIFAAIFMRRVVPKGTRITVILKNALVKLHRHSWKFSIEENPWTSLR